MAFENALGVRIDRKLGEAERILDGLALERSWCSSHCCCKHLSGLYSWRIGGFFVVGNFDGLGPASGQCSRNNAARLHCSQT